MDLQWSNHMLSSFLGLIVCICENNSYIDLISKYTILGMDKSDECMV